MTSAKGSYGETIELRRVGVGRCERDNIYNLECVRTCRFNSHCPTRLNSTVECVVSIGPALMVPVSPAHYALAYGSVALGDAAIRPSVCLFHVHSSTTVHFRAMVTTEP